MEEGNEDGVSGNSRKRGQLSDLRQEVKIVPRVIYSDET